MQGVRDLYLIGFSMQFASAKPARCTGSLRAFAGDAVAGGHGAVQRGDAGAVGVALGVA
jgi:hypothetical protein